MHPFLLSSAAVPLGRRLHDVNHEKHSRNERIYGGNGGQDASFSFSRSAARASFACPKSPKIFTTFVFSLPERATIFAASRAVSGCVYGFFVSLSSRLVCVTLSFSFCIIHRSCRRQRCFCGSNTCTTSTSRIPWNVPSSFSLLKVRWHIILIDYSFLLGIHLQYINPIYRKFISYGINRYW